MLTPNCCILELAITIPPAAGGRPKIRFGLRERIPICMGTCSAIQSILSIPRASTPKSPTSATVRNDVWGVSVFSEPCPCPLDHGVRWFKNEGWTTMVVVGTKRVRGSHWVFCHQIRDPEPKTMHAFKSNSRRARPSNEKILKDVRDRRERQIRDWREVPAQRSWWD